MIHSNEAYSFRFGTFFAPLIPAMTVVKLFLMFYARMVCADVDILHVQISELNNQNVN